MSDKDTFDTLPKMAERLRQRLGDKSPGSPNFLLLYAYNGTGKTRLSMTFKDAGKKAKGKRQPKKENTKDAAIKDYVTRDTLYFNAYTEDLFHWDNDLNHDSERILHLNKESRFFSGLEELEMESRIRAFLSPLADFDFFIDYNNWTVSFNREVQKNGEMKTVENIKVSRGEENIFIWCFFLAVARLTIEGQEAYRWVKYIYIDDPISSLDDNNVIAVACQLTKLLTVENRQDDSKTVRVKAVISSHHSLFFNVMFNELKKESSKSYFLHYCNSTNKYILRPTSDTPFFHHVAMLSELKKAAESGQLYTHHFNALRSILEKTASFFGFADFSKCIRDFDDDVLYARAVNLLSHGSYSLYEPKEMAEDNKNLFKGVLNTFLMHYEFDFPKIFNEKLPLNQQQP